MANEVLTYTLRPGRRGGVAILKLQGPLTLRTMFGFQDEFRAIRPEALILDLSDSPYMDSAGLGLVINQYVSAENGKRKFIVVGVNHRIGALFELTKMHKVLTVFETVDDAEAWAGRKAWIAI